jgi:hypothetical protein
LLAVLVAGPWLLQGYLFGTDWPGPRHFSVPTDFSSGTLLDALLVGVSAGVSAELTTKLVILIALFAAGLGAFRALPIGGFIPRAMASAIFVVNPFVYGRIHYGQLALVAGYALLPWIAATLFRLVREPASTQSLILAVELAALGILDLHLLIPAGLLLIAAGGASAYWLIPLLAGANSEGRTLGSVGAADLAVYSASADPNLRLVPNLLGLYGFWAEDTGRFDSMKAFVPLWPAILIALLLLGALGVKAAIQRRPEVDFGDGRPWLFALLGAGLIALILEMGV